jgi:hypothetical protein
MEDLTRRFSSWTVGLFRFLGETRTDVPVQGRRSTTPLRWTRRFEPPITYWSAVRTALEDALTDVVSQLPERGEWIEGYTLVITFENDPPRREAIRCGRVTRDIAYLLRLFDLRSSRLQISHRFMTGVTVEVTAGIGEIRQGELDLRLTRGGSGPADRDGSGPADRADGRSGGGAGVCPSGRCPRGRRSRSGRARPGAGSPRPDIAVLQAQLGADGVVRAATAPGRFPEDRFALIPLQKRQGPAGPPSCFRVRG